MSMKFWWEGKEVMLQGGASLGQSRLLLKAMLRTILYEGGTLELCRMEVNQDQEDLILEENVHEFMSSILKKFEGIFQMLEGLLTSRRKEHKIILKERNKIVSV